MSIRAQGFASVKAHVFLPALSALMLALAFPFPGWGVLAFVALVPLTILGLRSASVRRLVWTTWLVSMVWWMVVLRWMTPVSGGGHIFLGVYLAVYWPIALWLVRGFDRRFRMPCTFALPMAWVSLEWLRSVIIAGGFSWFTLGHTQAPFSDDHMLWHSRLIQIADVFGEFGVSFLIAMTNGLIVDVLTKPWVRPAGDNRPATVNRSLRLAALAWLIAMIGAWGYGQFRISQFDAVTERGPVVAVVQTNVPQNNKMSTDAEQLIKDWMQTIAMTKKAAALQPKPDMILWPESTPFYPLNLETVEYSANLGGEWGYCHDAIRALAKQLDSAMMVGGYARIGWHETDTGHAPREKYNSVYLYNRLGEQSDLRYDKIHLVPVGEYLPWIESVPALKESFFKYLSPYEHDYTIDRGENMTVFTIEYDFGNKQGQQIRVVTPICFEDTISRLCWRMVYAEDGTKRAQAMMNLTNDGWFTGSHQPWQHLQAATFRCIENRVPMVRSVNTGVSGYVDSLGRVNRVVRDETGKVQAAAGIASMPISIDSRTTIFGRIGHLPVIGLFALTAVLALAGRFRRDKLRAGE